MDEPWRQWSEAWPVWTDAGRRVAVRIDGAEIEGVLRIEDVFSDGEDEFPIWEVDTDAGEHHCFATNDEWRFLPSLGASRLVTGSAGETSGHP